MFNKLFRSTKIPFQAKEVFREGDFLFAFADQLPDGLSRHLGENIARWMGDRESASFDWAGSFSDSLRLSFLNDSFLPRGIVVKVPASRRIWNGITDLNDAFSKFKKIAVDINELKYISYTFLEDYTYGSILITDHCNINCVMCPYHSLEKSKELIKDKFKSMSFDAFAHAIKGFDKSKPFLISAAGEILINKDVMKIIELACKEFDYVAAGTNGLLMGKEVAERFIDLGLSEVNISVDGIDADYYEATRVGSSFETVLKNIAALKDIRDKKKSKAKITINCVMTERLQDKESEIVDFWRNKVDALSFLAERSTYTGESNCLFPSKDLFGKIGPCFAPFAEGPIVEPSGLIAPCCHLHIAQWYEDLDWLCNISDTSVNEAMVLYRRMLLDKTSPLSQYCRKCHFWRQSYSHGSSAMNKGYAF